jgi:hypothetical protein
MTVSNLIENPLREKKYHQFAGIGGIDAEQSVASFKLNHPFDGKV